MDALEQQLELKVPALEQPVTNDGVRSHNPGLRALLSIKNFSSTLQKDYTKLLQIEKDLKEAIANGLVVIELHAAKGAEDSWAITAATITETVSSIKEILNAAKQKIEEKETADFSESWHQLAVQVSQLKKNTKNAVSAGFKLLPETKFIAWENIFIRVQEQLVQSMIEHVDSCRVLLQMIEKYSPDELNIISKIVADKIPPEFTYEEAVAYRQDYYKALVNFKKEFADEKNLWDRFLDILAGGTHQPPSERIMFERWIEGEKGDL